MQETKQRCPWAKNNLEIKYHDEQWGKEEYCDDVLFEMLILEGMQAGVSWSCILGKRENMRQAFDGFNPHIIAEYGEEKFAELLNNPGILRNRAKIRSLPLNARAFLKIQQEFGSFSKYLWSFVDHKPIINQWTDISQVPAKTDLSEKMSKDLIKRGFKFVGPVICYAYMQSVGLVDDHLVNCPCKKIR